MKRRRVGQVLVLILLALAFWYGTQPDNLVSNVVYPPSPTPTPDVRVKMGKPVKVGELELTVKEAWRIYRPGDKNVSDLGILTVEFAGLRDCDEEELKECTFDRSKFKLVDESGKEQLLSQPPGKYIPGFKVIQLAQSRELNQLTAEEGQIYWLLDKNSEEFTLMYDEAKIKVVPKDYDYEDVKKNLSTTPGAR